MDFQVPGLEAVTLAFMLNSSLERICSPEMLQDPKERELVLPEQQLGNTCLLLGAAPGSQGFWRICTLEAANHPAAPKTDFNPSLWLAGPDPYSPLLLTAAVLDAVICVLSGSLLPAGHLLTSQPWISPATE